MRAYRYRYRYGYTCRSTAAVFRPKLHNYMPSDRVHNDDERSPRLKVRFFDYDIHLGIMPIRSLQGKDSDRYSSSYSVLSAVENLRRGWDVRYTFSWHMQQESECGFLSSRYKYNKPSATPRHCSTGYNLQHGHWAHHQHTPTCFYQSLGLISLLMISC